MRLILDRTMSGKVLASWLALVGLAPAAARAQDLVREGFRSFPRETIRLEYLRPAALRTMPNYRALRQQYVGPKLKALEESLSQLGIGEGDIDEIVLGWQFGGEAWELYGLSAGRFDPKSVGERAAAKGIAAAEVAGLPAYCLGREAAASCVLVLKESLGAFGTLRSLRALMEVRAERAPSLNANERIVKLASEAKTQVPIWGVAVGPAVPDYFKGWMPGQENLQMDWSRLFQTVDALAYSVEVADKVRLELKLQCATPEAASTVRQLFEGIRTLQQAAWQAQNPNRPNPYEALETEANARLVSLRLTTTYTAVEGARGSSAP